MAVGRWSQHQVSQAAVVQMVDLEDKDAGAELAVREGEGPSDAGEHAIVGDEGLAVMVGPWAGLDALRGRFVRVRDNGRAVRMDLGL